MITNAGRYRIFYSTCECWMIILWTSAYILPLCNTIKTNIDVTCRDVVLCDMLFTPLRAEKEVLKEVSGFKRVVHSFCQLPYHTPWTCACASCVFFIQTKPFKAVKRLRSQTSSKCCETYFCCLRTFNSSR